MNEQARARVATGLRWGGWGVVLAGAFLRAMVGIETLPHWDSDPTRMTLPLTGLTPAGSQVVDAIIMTGAGVSLLGETLAGAGVGVVFLMLTLAGAAGVAMHAVFIGGGSLEHARIGATWIAAMFAGLAGMHVCRDDRVRRATVAAATGLLMMLAAKGALQILVEHAATVAQFRADPEGFIAAQGWAKGSISARSFERRLLQAEATGWFGLANVYASFAAAGLVMLTGWTLLAWRQAKRPMRTLPNGWAGLLSVGMAAAAIALWLAGSKGGTTAAGIGLALLAGRMLLVRRDSLLAALPERAGGMLALALVLSAIGAVALRGMIGERMGELSLLFRWFYLEGAARIFAEHPALGVGPAGFKDAYMLAKPPISPEEVQSPHSVLFDFAATLGAAGLAWCGLWLTWIFQLGRRIVEREEAVVSSVAPTRMDWWFIVMTAVGPVAGSAWIERAIATPEAAMMRLLGLAAWLGVAAAVVQLAARTGAWRWIAALGALILAVHGQIEVTPVWVGSACVAMILLGACGAGHRTRPGWLAGPVLVAWAAAWGAVAVPWTVRWEASLGRAAAAVAPHAGIAERLTALRNPRERPEETMADVARDIGRITGLAAPTDDASLSRAMDALMAMNATAAAGELSRAIQIAPGHFATVETYCRMHLAAGAALARLHSPDAAGAFEAALGAAQELARRPSAGAFGLLGNVFSSTAEALGKPELVDRAVDAWTRASAMDPYGLSFAYRAFEAELAQGHAEAARRWAVELLRLDKLQRLDELKRLTTEQRQKVEGALHLP